MAFLAGCILDERTDAEGKARVGYVTVRVAIGNPKRHVRTEILTESRCDVAEAPEEAARDILAGHL